MMTYTQYLLCKLAEEASELAQAAMKAQQFGLQDTHQGETNEQRIRSELIDIKAVESLLLEIHALKQPRGQDHAKAVIRKIQKIAHWRAYSVKTGNVQLKT